MNKTTITARVSDQHLRLVNEALIASGGVDVVQIRFEFCDLWGSCGKTAVFYRDPDTVYHVPIVDGLATVPHEVLAAKGYFYFGVMGSASNIRTTEVLKVRVARGAITSATAEPEDPTPDIYQQLLAAYGVMEARLSELIAMPEGSGESVTVPEVVDAHVDYTGKTWPTLGDHLRGVGADLNEKVDDLEAELTGQVDDVVKLFPLQTNKIANGAVAPEKTSFVEYASSVGDMVKGLACKQGLSEKIAVQGGESYYFQNDLSMDAFSDVALVYFNVQGGIIRTERLGWFTTYADGVATSIPDDCTEIAFNRDSYTQEPFVGITVYSLDRVLRIPDMKVSTDNLDGAAVTMAKLADDVKLAIAAGGGEGIDLSGYYTKPETDAAIRDGLQSALRKEIVNNLPEQGEENVLYLLPRLEELSADEFTKTEVDTGQGMSYFNIYWKVNDEPYYTLDTLFVGDYFSNHILGIDQTQTVRGYKLMTFDPELGGGETLNGSSNNGFTPFRLATGENAYDTYMYINGEWTMLGGGSADDVLGDIDTALDSILAIQEALIGGGA